MGHGVFWNSNLFVLENTAHDLACVYHRPRRPGWYQGEQVYDENSRRTGTVVLSAELKVAPHSSPKGAQNGLLVGPCKPSTSNIPFKGP